MKKLFVDVSRLRDMGVLSVLLLAGCAVTPPRQAETPPPPPPVVTHAARTMIVLVPVSDANAAAWFKVFDTNPSLRAVIAISPRFKHLAQDPALRAKMAALQHAGRLSV